MYILIVCVTYLDDENCLSGWVLHIWTMSVTYLDDSYTSGRWSLQIRTTVTYLDDGCYIYGRALHIWTTEATYLDGYNSARHTSLCYNELNLRKTPHGSPSLAACIRCLLWGSVNTRLIPLITDLWYVSEYIRSAWSCHVLLNSCWFMRNIPHVPQHCFTGWCPWSNPDGYG